VRVLRDLLAHPDVDVAVVLTCRPSPEVGAGEEDFASIAAAHGLPMRRVDDLNRPDEIAFLRDADVDLGVSISWLHVLADEVVQSTRHGILNIHGGMLPAYRGNACGNWAILNGESRMGVTVHLMAGGQLDNGPIVRQSELPIGPETTIGEIMSSAEEMGVGMVMAAVEDFAAGTAAPRPQDDREASYCYPRLARDGQVDWSAPAQDVERLVRATGRPYPGAYSWYADVRDGERVKRLTIWRAEVTDSPLPTFHAVPGHVIKLDGDRRAVACGDGRLLALLDVEVDGVPVTPREAFRTVRQRLGLDVQGYVAQLTERLERLEQQVARLAPLPP
jgi:methionyl-tRNA formyltransferase